MNAGMMFMCLKRRQGCGSVRICLRSRLALEKRSSLLRESYEQIFPLPTCRVMIRDIRDSDQALVGKGYKVRRIDFLLLVQLFQ
jgi:hypothetical protein